jgi:hypothetical protein
MRETVFSKSLLLVGSGGWETFPSCLPIASSDAEIVYARSMLPEPSLLITMSDFIPMQDESKNTHNTITANICNLDFIKYS